MSDHDCPAEGCSYSGPKGSVRSHINAKSGEAHDDKEALRAALEAATDPPSVPVEETTDEESTDKPAQAASELAESDESDPEEAAPEGDAEAVEEGEDVPTKDEYQQQKAEMQGEAGDDQDDDEGDAPGAGEAAAAAAGGAGFLASVTDMNPLVLGALLLLALLVVSMWMSDDVGQPATTEPSTASTPAEAAQAAPSTGLQGAN